MSLPDDTSETSEGFSEAWLTLREPADHAARSQLLDTQLASWTSQFSTLRIVELGAGTGSNLRYLMPKLGHDQQWHLLDNDANLLNHLPEILNTWADGHQASVTLHDRQLHIEHNTFSATVSTQVLNLADDLDQIPLDNVNLITASALLDLTSAPWLDQLANLTMQHKCGCLFVLSYDGRIQWHPTLENDKQVSELLNQHQLNDKGFGLALGPAAADYFARALETQGRQITRQESDWAIDQQSQALQHAIVDGWAAAATEQDNSAETIISQWHALRKQAINDKISSLAVGHIDVLSLP